MVQKIPTHVVLELTIAAQYVAAEPAPTSCSFRILIMVSGKRVADIGYRAFSASMMLLTVYGGYLCAMRGYRYMQKQKQLKLAAENQDPEVIKDWRQLDCSCFCTDVDISHSCFFFFFYPSLNHEDVNSSQDIYVNSLWGHCALMKKIQEHIICISGLFQEWRWL